MVNAKSLTLGDRVLEMFRTLKKEVSIADKFLTSDPEPIKLADELMKNPYTRNFVFKFLYNEHDEILPGSVDSEYMTHGFYNAQLSSGEYADRMHYAYDVATTYLSYNKLDRVKFKKNGK